MCLCSGASLSGAEWTSSWPVSVGAGASHQRVWWQFYCRCVCLRPVWCAFLVCVATLGPGWTASTVPNLWSCSQSHLLAVLCVCLSLSLAVPLWNKAFLLPAPPLSNPCSNGFTCSCCAVAECYSHTISLCETVLSLFQRLVWPLSALPLQIIPDMLLC